MLSSFSTCSKKVMSIAESIAYDFGHINVGSEHLLLALAKDKSFSFKLILEQEGINSNKIRNKILKVNPIRQIKPVYMEYSSHLKHIIDSALEESKQNQKNQIELDQLTKSMLSEVDSFAVQIIMELDGDINALKKEIDNKSKDNIEDLINLNNKVKQTKPRLIGREKELEQIQDVLLKKNKRNIILIGEPGVGKTAIVEELARRINDNEIKLGLENKVIYQLNISDMVAGTKYRGEFEEKLKKLIHKIQNKKDVIVFIDEIHSIVGAGGAEGAIDASNILKPYLSSGEINCIGATTFDEYSKSIEKEKAFQRRFQVIKIEESSLKETIDILLKTKEDYEKFHGIKIEDEAIKEIVDYSDSYIVNKMLPDKAIDLLDVLCVKAKNDRNNLTTKKVKEYLDKNVIDIIDSCEIDLIKETLGNTSHLFIDAIKMAKRHKDAPLLSVLLYGNGDSNLIKKVANCFKKFYFIKIDLKDYRENISVSKLLGALPGYVGYEHNTIFSEINRHSFCIVLFQNYNLGSDKVREIINTILNEGVIIDNSQRKIDFRNCLVFIENEKEQNQNLGFINCNSQRKNQLKTDCIIDLEKKKITN